MTNRDEHNYLHDLALLVQELADRDMNIVREKEENAKKREDLDMLLINLLKKVNTVISEHHESVLGTSSDIPTPYVNTVIGYARLTGIDLHELDIHDLFRKSDELCAHSDIDVERIHDPRFGKVGLYPESILKTVFGII